VLCIFLLLTLMAYVVWVRAEEGAFDPRRRLCCGPGGEARR
jgi:hypothetical protein